MAATSIAASSVASSSRLLITPYTPSRDVLLWDRDAKSWLRIDLGNELEPTVDWLSGAITRQLGQQGGVTRIFLGGSSEALTLDERKRPIEYFTFDDYLSFTSRSARTSMQIFAKSPEGKTITLTVDSGDRIEAVAGRLAIQLSIPTDKQRLIFDGQQLEDGRTLASYNIGQDSMLQVLMRLQGGATGGSHVFVDVSNEAGLKRRPWNPPVPKWRIAGRGLNLEGRCTNSDCEAHEQMVIMQLSFRVFDVLLDSNAQTTRCPCCKTFVQPLTCAFSNCEWKWTGLKASVRGDPAQRTQSLDWSKAGDEYARFDPSDVKEGGSGLVSWLRLKIQTRASASIGQSKARTCSVCLGTDATDVEKGLKCAWSTAPCSHHSHAICMDAWQAFQKLQGRCASCPMCRGALA